MVVDLLEFEGLYRMICFFGCMVKFIFFKIWNCLYYLLMFFSVIIVLVGCSKIWFIVFLMWCMFGVKMFF